MYTTTRNDLDTLLHIDSLWNNETSVAQLIEAFQSDNWQVQQAALWAVGNRAEKEALPAIEQLLIEQDDLPVYGCPDEWNFDAATSDDERETWRCRFRVKQAALIAINGCVKQHGFDSIPESLFARVLHYATSMADDYPVRVAACELLGAIGRPEAKETLQQAAQDGEWCTATTASKALVKL